ncbi:translocation protein SEC62 [Phlebotomus argentipes]|uniref:translocation protein SEC62 n=1 Tax=Phlebotomus argentipes TaxID=94469 RepID=UPI002892C4FF|nr:translocation protein SEC62 [Phlebotomus argentipes]
MDKKRVKTKRRKDEYTGPGGVEEVVEKPPNEEYSLAKWLRRNVPTKKTKCLNHNVEYFTASKALDALMESKFAKGSSPLLPSREAAIEILDSMLVHKFFHRAKKLPVTDEELRGRKKGDEKAKKPVEVEKKEVEKGTDAESSHVEGGKPERVDKEKKKRKIRLDMHPEQVFVDGSEAYVWIYDPIPLHYWLFGALLVVFVIVMCLFPLWPTPLRLGVYYLSIAAAGFLVFILGLAVVRFIVFCVVWLATGSKHHFWLFPNLTEDVGFLASFWPLYKHEYKGVEDKCKKCKKQHKEKDSDDEDETCPLAKKKKASKEKEDADDTPSQAAEATKEVEAKDAADHRDEEAEKRKSSLTPSESESESSQRSSTGKDFEIVDSTDLSPE